MTGSPYWAERDYLRNVRKIKAGVFVVHGLSDWNVKTKNAGQLWEALKKNHVPRKLWLHQAGHTNPMPLRMEEWLRQVHHWFDHYLYGIDNGITKEPPSRRRAGRLQLASAAGLARPRHPGHDAAAARRRLPRPLRGPGHRAVADRRGAASPAEQLVTSPDAANGPARVHDRASTVTYGSTGVPEVDDAFVTLGTSPYVTAAARRLRKGHPRRPGRSPTPRSRSADGERARTARRDRLRLPDEARHAERGLQDRDAGLARRPQPRLVRAPEQGRRGPGGTGCAGTCSRRTTSSRPGTGSAWC
ncbi:CocE/NonD family hydrolase [Streptomyces sp. KL116D]|uniref:CocE/NonD family hydrolase n=1 Tax=Streptomyces sp. KL116D TaxID=3045152 RepID=UPI0035579E6B